jgi:hypothetical protein
MTFFIGGNGANYGVRLKIRAGVNEYPVRLNRLWFWPLLGAAPKVSSATSGFTATLAGLRSGDNLY